MDTHHLHTRIEEEDTAGKDKVIELLQVREESCAHIHIVMTARNKVYHTQNNEQRCRNNSTDNTAPFTDFSDPIQTLERDKCRRPIDCKHDDKRKEFIRGKCHICLLIHTDKGYRNGTECKHRRVPDSRLNPLQPDGKEARSCTESLANPAKDTTLLITKHCSQLCSHKCRRDKEDKGGKKIVEC